MKKGRALVVFGKDLPVEERGHYDLVLSGDQLKSLIEPGSIYDGTKFSEELSRVTLPNGERVTKSLVYEGYELWWMNYNGLFTYFGLPYTQYKKMLESLLTFEHVSFVNPPFKNLFIHYLQAHDIEVEILDEARHFIHLGVFIQLLITIVSLPLLILKQSSVLFFTGDKFEKGKDYDFRMRFVYQELRRKEIPFVEFVRSLESWKTVLQHAWVRRRPVIYSEAVALLGRTLSAVSSKRFDEDLFSTQLPEARFKSLVATHYLRNASADIWAIRITKMILSLIGVRAAFFTAFTERNAHAVLGCKLNRIPTVGVLHGLPTRYYNIYDFLPGFDGEKVLTVDKYGLWSEYWREYYARYAPAYRKEQLYLSGPMRPLDPKDKHETDESEPTKKDGKTRVLFIAEQLAAPEEVLPYIYRLLKEPSLELTLKFRPSRDGFEEWLLKNEPELLKSPNLKVSKAGIQDAVRTTHIAVGSHSTAVLEALLELKIPIFYNTHKWGDCFSLREYGDNHPFFADTPDELVEKIRNSRNITPEVLKDLQKRYFGDPYQNGSAWVVDQLEGFLATT